MAWGQMGAKVIKGGNATIFVSSVSQAVDFYANKLGLKLDYQVGEHWAQVDAGGTKLGLHPPSDTAAPPGTRNSIQIGFEAAEGLEQSIDALKQRGVNFDGPIHEDTSTRIAFFRDPDGTILYLVEIKRA